ncbi:MAG: hypothetical protein CMJ83_10955 [Planctomycetes bacterium]|nr:hypothetical protein [Planctomycetota bacterium]
MVESADKPGEIPPETIAQINRRVWDMTLNLLHPAAFYVLFQLLIGDHFSQSPALAGRHVLHPLSLLLYGFQFLGAWAVFYTTLLRDMGYRSAWGTILLLCALAGVILQFVVFPRPQDASAASSWAFIAVQLVLAAAGWGFTFRRWRRLKRRWQEPPVAGGAPS